MADSNVYWEHISRRQDAASAQAREASPVTVQVPKTGQQLTLELPFRQSRTEASVQITLVPEAQFARADAAVWIGGLLFVLLFRHAVRRLHAWVEVLVVALYLTTEVILELRSPALAADFLRAGLVGLAVLALVNGILRMHRMVSQRLARTEGGL